MNSIPGYHGCYLRVDLSTRATQTVPIPPGILRRFIGGVGLGTWLLLKEMPDGCDALHPSAPLLFVFSPLVGTPLTTSGKFAVVAKSPLTYRINDSLSSSHFAIAGKKTGHDAIVLVGRAEEPICLVVEPKGVQFVDAEDAWGRSVSETEAWCRRRLGSSFRTAVIGPAGENGVRFATISHDGRHAGRGGLGAVMGSKNVKAVAVRGDCTTPVARPEKLIALSRDLSRRSFGPATAKYRELGTVSNLLVFNRLGTLPTRNFQSGSFENAVDLAPETIDASRKKARHSCAACTIGCEQIYRLPNANSATSKQGVRMEYENLFALGPLCGISDPDTVLQASHLCDEFGMDTISTGATIAFAMECAERGLLDEPNLRFGDGSVLLSMIDSIANRTAGGELLAEGTRIAAAHIGGEAPDFAPQVKGLEIPGYEPRALQTMALGFAVGSRGADHNRSGAYQVDFSDAVDRTDIQPLAIEMAIETENEAAIMDSLILCKFLRGVFEDKLAEMSELLKPVTGWDVTADELRETAERIVSVKKWFNISQGWTPAEDTLPRRFLSEPLGGGQSEGARLTESRLKEMIALYNRARRWTEEGYLPPERLRELELVTASA